MNRVMWAIVAVAAIGCSNDVGVRTIEARGEVSPYLQDLGQGWVGGSYQGDLLVTSSNAAEIEILNVEVLNVQGNAFSFDDVDLDPVAKTFIVRWEPTEVGFDLAQVSVTTNAINSPHTVDIRGQAVAPELLINPGGVDYGPVPAGSSATETLTFRNVFEQDLQVTEATLSDAAFTLDATLPLTVPGNGDVTVDVVFDAADDAAVTGTLEVAVGGYTIGQTVPLRANDCENGVADKYDQDGDGYTLCAGDCDDGDADVHPGQVEIYDELDQDCDGIVDEGTVGYDDDGDGYCEHGDNCSDGSTPGDCNDGDASVNPGETEDMSNGLDDDCDGVVDQGTTDLDGDGYNGAAGDCNESDPTVYPGAPELPDSIDNDCDGTVDEGTTGRDDDGDGYCEDPAVCTDGSTPGDCNDDDTTMNPGASESPDGRDNNCNGGVDEGTINGDDDGDGFTEVGGDCDDTDPTVNPAQNNCG